MNSILFTLPGSPVVYYGDEIGMGENFWLDDRDGVRTSMQWDARPNAGFTGRDAPAEHLYAPVIDDNRFGYQRINVSAQRAVPKSLWHTTRRMIAVRKQYRAFSRGNCDFADPAEADLVLARAREAAQATILSAHVRVLGGRGIQLGRLT